MRGLDIFKLAGVEEKEEEITQSPLPARTAPAEAPAAALAPQVKAPQDIFSVAGVEAPTASEAYITNKDVTSDSKRMESVRNYMMHRKGDYYRDAAPEEVLDDFVDHMRWVETNEVNTFGEARAVFDLEDSEKPLYSNAYAIYDSLGQAYQAGGIGEVADAAAHYTGAVLASPSTWLGGFIGRAFSKGGSKAAVKATNEVLKTTLAPEVGKKGFKEAVKSTGKMLEKTLARKEGHVAAKKSRKDMVTAAIIGATVDGAMGGGQNLLLQDTKIEAGYQEERDYKEAAFNTVFGVVGGGVAYFPDAMRGTIKLTDVDQKITLANKIRSKEAKKVVGKKLEQSAKKLSTDWEEVAKKGQSQDVNKFLRDKSINWFFDIEDENSFVSILQKSGADLGADEKTFSHKVVEFARGIPPKQKEAITESLKPLGVSFGELIEIFAGSLKEGGETLSAASKASRFMENFKHIAVTKRKAADNTINGEEELAKAAKTAKAAKEAPSPEVLRYTASVWKRLLISHPATTALNVKGWAWAASARALSEILHGGVVGSAGLAGKMMGVKSADKTLAKSAAMFKSNGLLIRSLMDPYTSVQGFRDLLEKAPKKYKKDSLASFFGGVGDERPDMFKINPNNKAVKGIENTIDAAARLAFVKVQDIYTKSFSGLKELDKMSRIELGKGIEELLAKGETHLITDAMWDKTVKTLLEDTFSVNYTRGGSGFSKAAKVMEDISSHSLGGFLFPFGRFVNNTIGFLYQYSPLAFLPLTKYQKGLDLEERLMKAAVGTSALALVFAREEEKQKEGLQWNEERNTTGDIEDVQGIFPMSLYNLMGRIMVNINNGGGIPLHLKDELIKQVGPLGTLDDLTSSNPITDMVRELSKAAESDEGVSLIEFSKMVGEMVLGTTANIAAGFTRPLDPINDLAGAALDLSGDVDDRAIDRKQAEGSDAILQNFGRYTNTFFNMLLGEDTGDGKLFGKPKNSATERDSVKDPNPMSRTLGNPLKPRQDSFDILLGMVDMAPYKADSFTSGVPEYDDFINDTVFPILERKSQALLDSEIFQSRPISVKRDMVSKLITEARKEVLEGLENGSLGEEEDYMYNERRKFISSNPQAYRAEAKKALNIKTEDRELTYDELLQLQMWIDINKDLDEMDIEYK